MLKYKKIRGVSIWLAILLRCTLYLACLAPARELWPCVYSALLWVVVVVMFLAVLYLYIANGLQLKILPCRWFVSVNSTHQNTSRSSVFLYCASQVNEHCVLQLMETCWSRALTQLFGQLIFLMYWTVLTELSVTQNLKLPQEIVQKKMSAHLEMQLLDPIDSQPCYSTVKKRYTYIHFTGCL